MFNETPVVHNDPEILDGTPVFVGTRVPVKSLYDYLEAVDRSTSFSRAFPRSLASKKLRLLSWSSTTQR